MNKDYEQKRNSRQVAFQMIYSFEITNSLRNVTSKDLSNFFTNFEIEENLQPYALEIFVNACENTAIIDLVISSNLRNWKFDRISLVDKCLMRMIISERMLDSDTGMAVYLDEAIEIAKIYGDAESPKFLNGILETIFTSKNLKDT